MSEPKWTAEQLAAIQLRGQLLVAAAAGSGKTAVLVKRLIHRITDLVDPVDVDRFLVVTFTKAAANEMRERIGKALDEALFHELEIGTVERLLRQRTLLQRASITTLHSFCLELIRKHFYQLELDPAFRVADQAEAELLRLDVVEALFVTHYEREKADFIKLVDAFGSDRDDQPLMDHVLQLYNFAYSQPHPAEWLSSLTKGYEWETIEALMQSEWGHAVRQGITDLVSESLNLLERAELITQHQDGPSTYAVTLQDDLNRVGLLKRALKEGDWSKVEAQFQSAVDFPKLKPIRSKLKTSASDQVTVNVDLTSQKSLQEECKKLREDAKKRLNSLQDDVFAFPLERQLPALREMGSMVHTFGSLVREFSQDYKTAKEARNILDFTDLEHYALQLLEEEGEASLIAKGLQDYFEEVLVDEYQDINPVQERILQLVSRQNVLPNLFMVGDVKQSIYRFRMADPSLFLAKYSELPHWNPSALTETSSEKMVIDLNKNFRSRHEVVDGVNFIFRQIMTKGAGEVDYDDQSALQYGASFISGQNQLCTAEGPIEVHLMDSKTIKKQLSESSCDEDTANLESLTGNPLGSEEQSPPELEETLSHEDLDKARIEARLVSERIQQLVQRSEFQIYDQDLKCFRPVRYSDIVILMRSFSAVAPIYVEEFQRSNIPVYAETTSGYFGASEVETMLSLLKIIDNPHMDIPLAAVLRSPLVGLNGSELGKIRMILPEGDFYEALTLGVWAGLASANLEQAQAYEPDFRQILSLYEDTWEQRIEKAELILNTVPDLKTNIIKFWTNLQSWRTRARRTSLAELLWSLYEETGYLSYVGTLPAGIQRQANLRVLYDRASRFEATRYRGLFRFLRFLDRFQGQGKDMGNARALGENENVVRLITVHASKGLEFPVVFVVGLGRTFNTQSLKGKMLLHSRLGIGVPIIDVENNVRYPSLIQYAVKNRLAQESLSEELRILYVALTRAKERLLLYGNIDNFHKTLAKWHRTCEGEEIPLPEGLLRSARCYLDWIGPALARHPEHLFGEDFPETSQTPYSIPDSSSRWEIHLHQSLTTDKIKSNENNLQESNVVKREQIEIENPPETMKIEEMIERVDPDEYESECSTNDKTTEQWYIEVNQRLSWQYPYLNSVRQIAKTSVSELKRQNTWHTDVDVSLIHTLSSNETNYLKRPKFLQSSHSLTAAERGTALHTVMQHVPFKELSSFWSNLAPQEQLDYVLDFLNRLQQREILSAEQTSVIQPEQIVEFLGSPLGQRLANAEQVLREVPFTLTIPKTDQTSILIQGVIDVVIIDRDDCQKKKAEILDYKTDAFYSENKISPEEILQKRYALQLSLYALAIEHLAKIDVSKCTLYSFTLGREVDISMEHRKNSLQNSIPLLG